MGIYGTTQAKIDVAAISKVMRVSEEAWYNGKIEIVDPRIQGGPYNPHTNTKDRSGSEAPVVIWSGDARIQAVRWPNVATTRQEAASLRTVVFHIPLSPEADPDLILEGFRVRVIDGGLAPEFEHGLFVVTATTNTSYAWSRRIEAMMDQGARIN